MQMIELTSSYVNTNDLKFIINTVHIRRICKSAREDAYYSGTNAIIEYHNGAEEVTYHVKETYEELKKLLCK